MYVVCMMEKYKAILSDHIFEDITLVEMFAVVVEDKTKTSMLLRKLTKLYPIPELGHLKRVKSAGDTIQVLITPTHGDTLQTFAVKFWSQIDFDSIGILKTVEVGANKPITRAQFEVASNYWPTSFHENKRLEAMIRGDFFTVKQLSQIRAFMNVASSLGKCKEQVTNKAVIIDPLTATIIAQGQADPNHPLKHAVMVAIDNIAIQQGGGAWNKDKASLLQISESRSVDLTQKIRATTSAEYDDESVEVVSEDYKGPIAKRPKKSDQYLCTGYDLYTMKEPCVMCSMALLHSRIGRVFYSEKNKRNGGLGSKYKIHLQERLNHHFEVYIINMQI